MDAGDRCVSAALVEWSAAKVFWEDVGFDPSVEYIVISRLVTIAMLTVCFVDFHHVDLPELRDVDSGALFLPVCDQGLGAKEGAAGRTALKVGGLPSLLRNRLRQVGLNVLCARFPGEARVTIGTPGHPAAEDGIRRWLGHAFLVLR